MSQPDPPVKRQYSAGGTAALLVVGLLFLVPSGLCTGILGGGALIEAFLHPENAGETLSVILMALMFGGPFLVAGGAMVWFGVKRARGR
jgi:hypothetical protein